MKIQTRCVVKGALTSMFWEEVPRGTEEAVLQSQFLVEFGGGVPNSLAKGYENLCADLEDTQVQVDRLVETGLRLGGFLSDAGWFAESERILLACQEIFKWARKEGRIWLQILECCQKLLHVQSSYCHFEEADVTYNASVTTVVGLQGDFVTANLAVLYKEFSALHFNRSEYSLAHYWAVESLRAITTELPPCVIIEVFRQASKACVVKREFKRAALLAREVLCLANEVFDVNDPRYADALMDYGFFLINHDRVRQSVSIYELALDIRLAMFGPMNLHVAIAHEDLAYALYVYEYSSGRFIRAREHADKALFIMEKLLPRNHLLLASVRRVKALILEEIALDNMVHDAGTHILLQNAEELHKSALDLALRTFGERNVQTAKHFGNLGRLYQSMSRFQEAEAMHLKAIAIKENLLGSTDYEVGLSIGHLASLYNYHMKKYRKAEELYHRSLDISLKLFGESYSGLEYDYRGLIHVYHKLGDIEKVAQYTYVLNNWKIQRQLSLIQEDDPLDSVGSPLPIADVAALFFEDDLD
ncbi:amyloid protein-binding protein 2 isoform X2 [Anabrus simplex]|uniref:amyloid protein-binding protein 2 isoform X2 n=1 Tax=Anabrus simplex TaxID=316456 RepID=UPI0034DD355B